MCLIYIIYNNLTVKINVKMNKLTLDVKEQTTRLNYYKKILDKGESNYSIMLLNVKFCVKDYILHLMSLYPNISRLYEVFVGP